MTDDKRLVQNTPKITWEWDLFGGGQITLLVADDVKQPSWWRRMMTRVLLGSTWERK